MIKFPENRPEIAFQGVHHWIAGNYRPAKPPLPGMFDQSVLASVVDDVEAHLCERVAFALFGSQDVIVRLVLEAMRAQLWPEVLTQEFDAIPLIVVAPQSHPNQMNMIRHQAIGRTEDSLAHPGMEHDFAKMGMECIVQPSSAAHGHRHRPMNDRIGLIILAGKTLEVEASIRARATELICSIRLIGRLHLVRAD